MTQCTANKTQYKDQTVTLTYAELKVLRNAIICYENGENKQYDDLYDKVEKALHTALAEAIRENREKRGEF